MYGGEDSPEFAEAAIPLKWGQIGRARRVFSANLKPGIYALVSRQPSLLPYIQVVLGPTCYMFELRTASLTEDTAASAQKTIEEALTDAQTAALTVGEVNVGEELRDIVQDTQNSFEGISDAASAEAAVPTLNDINTRLEELSATVDQLPEDAKKVLADVLGDQVTELKTLADSVTNQAGVGDILTPSLEPIMAKLGDWAPQPVPTRWRVLTERARIRAAPSTAAEILTTLPAGTLLPLAGSADPEAEWLAVSFDGRDGFVATRLTRPAYAPPDTIDGAATVADTGTLEVGSSVVRLFGIAGEGGEPARCMALFVQEQGGRVSCSHKDAARYVCQLGGRDVAEVALFNGAARAAADAPEGYRQRETQAREAGRGIWRTERSARTRRGWLPGQKARLESGATGRCPDEHRDGYEIWHVVGGGCAHARGLCAPCISTWRRARP